MRFPTEIQYAGTKETLQIQDHKMVFQLANALNDFNDYRSSLSVDFIPFIQSSANVPAATSKRRPDGTVPGMAEVAANPALADNATATYSNATAVAIGKAAYTSWIGLSKGRMKDIATNVYRAHKQAIKDGLFDYSESMYLRYALHTGVNITDQIASTGDYAPAWPYEWVYFSATTWKTIDKGLSRLPAAFMPLVRNRTSFGISVSELNWDPTTEKITARWRPADSSPFDMATSSEEFDYAIVAAPFTKVRLWRLPPYSSLLMRAINTLNYQQACKVALHYKSRFWERLPYPIYGGCGNTNIPGIGSICYPSYRINSTGPGVILASYVPGVQARTAGSMSTIDHVALVQRAMVETHGSIAATEWSGNYDRICWENNEFQAGAWCQPLVGQEELYLPAYYQTEMHTVFIGEHTSFTHAWIASALESAVRGAAQLLLDMGLVDEAKSVTTTWMARWLRM
jgi:monoamine oxidase